MQCNSVKSWCYIRLCFIEVKYIVQKGQKALIVLRVSIATHYKDCHIDVNTYKYEEII